MRTLLFILLAAIALDVQSELFAASDVRGDTRLDTGWRFIQSEVANGADTSVNDSSWQAISIPHCWGWTEAQQGNTKFYRGPGWYRRELNVVPNPGRRYFLRFEAASQVADVFLNGKLLGEHRGGFGAFCFEVTGRLAPTGANLLAVRVSNEMFPDVAPLDGDFNVYGGVYRPVHLIETAAQCFTPLDHASPGVVWQQTSVSAQHAVLDVTAEISNGTDDGRPFTLFPDGFVTSNDPDGQKSPKGNFTLVATVFDTAGHTVADVRQPIVLSQNATEPFQLHLTVENPHLWDGRRDPYLYRAIIELHSLDGALVDSVEQPLGLRFYRIDPEKGFFLNGHLYQLYGVCKHQDRAGKGWAVSEADLDEDMTLLKELGVRVIRCAHYQHSDYFYSLCDKAGILVWAEIPQIVQIGKTPVFAETSRNQLLDLIRQNINHPSIFVWSLFNELCPGGGADPHRELSDLNIVAHGEDPIRPTIGATSHGTWGQMIKIPDQLGWNRYPGWYTTINEFSESWQPYQSTSRSGGICISEYGAGANIAQHQEAQKFPSPNGQWHPEEWQCIVHETAWKTFKSYPFIWGTFVWNMFDFCVATRHEGGQMALNDKGLVTYDRKVRKDAFFFYKANWSDQPTLYITSRRFTNRIHTDTTVKVYSNVKTVELFVNGRSQGFCVNDGNAVFLWPKVTLASGANHIEARATGDNSQPLSDSCVWNLTAD
jgi:beta-galactosidase